MSALDRIFRWTLALVLVAFAILLATLVGEAPALTWGNAPTLSSPPELVDGYRLGAVVLGEEGCGRLHATILGPTGHSNARSPTTRPASPDVPTVSCGSTMPDSVVRLAGGGYAKHSLNPRDPELVPGPRLRKHRGPPPRSAADRQR
jgi:hypothetical protein